jgi:hypothetical protein
MMSRWRSTPARRPFLTTGSCRTSLPVSLFKASAASSSGVATISSRVGVMMSRTGVCSQRSRVLARMSSSVTMPTNVPVRLKNLVCCLAQPFPTGRPFLTPRQNQELSKTITVTTLKGPATISELGLGWLNHAKDEVFLSNSILFLTG